MQSECFDIFYKSNAHAVVSSPTGSGKTVLFELAILRLLSEENYHQYKERDKLLISGCLCRSNEGAVSKMLTKDVTKERKIGKRSSNLLNFRAMR
jgi:hypothetical protein